MFCVLLGFEAENALFYRLKKEKYYFVGFSIGVDESDAKMKFLEQINKQNKIEDKLMTF
jgi:hypothetical protein